MQTLVGTALSINRFAYASLVSIGADGQLQPAVATKWSATATSATFTIRDGGHVAADEPVRRALVQAVDLKQLVRYLCDRIAVLDEGRRVESGPAQEVLRDPQHETTRTLLASIPARPAVPAGQEGAA
ncbi:hypothetical protein ACQP1P_21800 [Dactylosporangium sp. CA-052675]|uniref:hypothetical protein n=1 Tax=Dactylosporangium sp. CA-052675 TaxID=3239927 RepID=UPI003D8D45BE